MRTERFRDDSERRRILTYPISNFRYVDYYYMLRGSTFESKLETLCVLSCKRTVLLKRTPDLQKGKNVKVGSGNFTVR